MRTSALGKGRWAATLLLHTAVAGAMPQASPPAGAAAAPAPADALLAGLARHCGQAFARATIQHA
jgi:hypothetical protein